MPKVATTQRAAPLAACLVPRTRNSTTSPLINGPQDYCSHRNPKSYPSSRRRFDVEQHRLALNLANAGHHTLASLPRHNSDRSLLRLTNDEALLCLPRFANLSHRSHSSRSRPTQTRERGQDE